MIDKLRPLSNAILSYVIGALVLISAPLVAFGFEGEVSWFVVGPCVLFVAAAAFASSVRLLALPIAAMMIGAVRAVESAMVFALCGLVVVGAIWLVDTSRDARRNARIDTRVSSMRRRSAGLVVAGALVLVGVSSLASRFGNDAGIYLPVGLFVCAGLVGVMARWIGRTSDPSVSDWFAPGRRV